MVLFVSKKIYQDKASLKSKLILSPVCLSLIGRTFAEGCLFLNEDPLHPWPKRFAWRSRLCPFIYKLKAQRFSKNLNWNKLRNLFAIIAAITPEFFGAKTYYWLVFTVFIKRAKWCKRRIQQFGFSLSQIFWIGRERSFLMNRHESYFAHGNNLLEKTVVYM